MENKLQDLMEKIYEEGVEKGRQRAEEIIAEAEKEAEKLIGRAKKEAESVISSAEKNALQVRERTEAEVRLAGKQAMRAFKTEIEDIIVAEALNKELKASMNNLDNIKDYIKEVIKHWHPEMSGSPGLELLLPENKRKELEKWFKVEMGKVINNGVNIDFHRKIKNGFQIKLKDGGYRINLTDEDFLEFFKEYLTPVARELLFGEKQSD